MKIKISRMLVSDAEKVVELGLQTTELQVDSTPMYYDVDDIRSAVKSKDEICLTLNVDDQFAGFMITHYNKVFREAYISDIAIKKEYRKMGLGQLLSAKSTEILKKKGLNWAWALVQDTNEPMQKFMELQGFLKGKKFFFYYKNQ